MDSRKQELQALAESLRHTIHELSHKATLIEGAITLIDVPPMTEEERLEAEFAEQRDAHQVLVSMLENDLAHTPDDRLAELATMYGIDAMPDPDDEDFGPPATEEEIQAIADAMPDPDDEDFGPRKPS